MCADIIEILCSEALHKLKRKIPYGWDLNIYRGCSHQCQYCYAMASHRYLDVGGFFDTVCVKVNLVEQLEKELASASWQREIINIGGVTDSYQLTEEHYQLMPDVLKLLIKYRTPAIISTKSALVLRDFDLIDRLSRITYVNIAATVTTMDEQLRTMLEPEAAPSLARTDMLKQFRKTNASVGLHLMPIIPGLTDDQNNLEQIFSLAREANVHYLLPGTLYLRGETRKHFLGFLDVNFPEIRERYRSLYKTGAAEKAYKTELYQKINRLREIYGVSGSYTKPLRDKMPRGYNGYTMRIL